MITRSISLALSLLALFAASTVAQPFFGSPAAIIDQPVSGSGVHYFTTAIIHSSQPTPTGYVQRSTDTVELTGDLSGRILYHPVSVFDFVNGTLVNTGHQIFSGSVLGSEPVLLLDDEFRFEVDLATGATVGEVHLMRRLAGPNIQCHLTVIGTGRTPEGNGTFDYSGDCRVRPRVVEAARRDSELL